MARNSAGSGSRTGRHHQQPDVLLPGAGSPRASSENAGASSTSVKISAICSASATVTGAVDRDDAAERGHRVAGMGPRWARAIVRVVAAGHDRDATRVGVLDDRDRGIGEVAGRPPRRVDVDVVVVAHLLAVQLLRRRQTRAGQLPVERGLLVRVLAVPQRRHLVPGGTGPLRPAVVRAVTAR